MQQPTSGGGEALPSHLTALLAPRGHGRSSKTAPAGAPRTSRAGAGRCGGFSGGRRPGDLVSGAGGWLASWLGGRSGAGGFGSGLGGQHRRGEEGEGDAFVCACVCAACGGGAPECEAGDEPRRGRLRHMPGSGWEDFLSRPRRAAVYGKQNDWAGDDGGDPTAVDPTVGFIN
jgi:hypothetical protein